MDIIEIINKYENMFIHPDCENEIIDLIKKAGTIKPFINKLRQNLDILDKHEHSAILHKNFESLKNCKNLFSMRIKGEGYNIRVLYSFSKNNKLLLCGFFEKGGKRKTGYADPIEIAKIRIPELQKIIEEGSE